jgi:hypothetical protein
MRGMVWRVVLFLKLSRDRFSVLGQRWPIIPHASLETPHEWHADVETYLS